MSRDSNRHDVGCFVAEMRCQRHVEVVECFNDYLHRLDLRVVRRKE